MVAVITGRLLDGYFLGPSGWLLSLCGAFWMVAVISKKKKKTARWLLDSQEKRRPARRGPQQVQELSQLYLNDNT